jgi:peptidyl-tRNA hydrolase, PTH1 family
VKLIVGLGNPGSKYQQTRHNVGFMVIDEVLKRHQLQAKYDAKFNAEVAVFKNNTDTLIFAKPSTFMNLSGETIYKMIHYYQIDIDDVLVVVDDVNIDTGRLRLRPIGGHGGHNGLRHIIGLLKSEDFKRIRIGIGYQNNMPLDKFVLGKFDTDELPLIEKAVTQSANAVMTYIQGVPFIDVMTKYNTQT